MKREQTGEVIILRPNGPALTSENHGELHEAFQPIAGRPMQAVLLDLDRVDHVDSIDLGAIVAGRLKLKGTGDIHLCGLAPNVGSVVHFSRLDLIFTVHNSKEAAMTALQ
ncbi:MAG: STAS domain-containing protein [Candidatus Sumerlaeota bacterium]|nr:STAS domain-containing protein [Candidatus Sumerlaeota bacterium]